LTYPTAEQLRPHLPEGLEIEDDLLFQGGQRAVFTGTRNGDAVVVKVMHEWARDRAEREVAIGHTFDHPNLATILDHELQEAEIEDMKFVYFSEERIDGESLAGCEAAMDSCQALRLARDLVAAVTYLWEGHHVVHRDIKPINIIKAPDNRFVLLDIGIGRHQSEPTLTRVAMEHGPGTEGYLAPEQLAPLKGRELDFRADLFAIGVVMYEMLTGSLPFDPTQLSYRTRLTTGLLPDLEPLGEHMEKLLMRLLAPQPHGRYRLDKAQEAINGTMEELECF
jgi:serine/threonine protein kinase